MRKYFSHSMTSLALVACMLTIGTAAVQAQRFSVVRGGCLPTADEQTEVTGQLRAGRLGATLTPITEWDSTRIYHQMVVLVSFADLDFSSEDPHALYNSILNESGYNQRKGKGCVAEYFRDQSGGLLNLQFDVYGPIKLDVAARRESGRKGGDDFRAAAKKLIDDNLCTDFSPYDWNGDRQVEQVIYVYAGFNGNQGSADVEGYIWPNTYYFNNIATPDGLIISNYTASGELWMGGDNPSFGIGTICHEFAHNLGLPDVYPTNGWLFSAVDEWDLMDGGNFTNLGWCPPNFSPLEKMLLGWLEPIELDKPTSIRDMKPVAQGGPAYLVRHTENEYLLLENRQREGWDRGNPGHGLVIYHVNFNASAWRNNSLNNSHDLRYQLVHADNMDYDAWDMLLDANPDLSTYAESGWMCSRILSTSPFPFVQDGVIVNDELTDTSVPAAYMHTNSTGSGMLLAKPITNISESEDGLVSFDFMGGDPTIVSPAITERSEQGATVAYDLSGRRNSGRPTTHGIYIERRADGTARKVLR